MHHYSPLESLVVAQAAAHYGLSNFSKISDELRNSEIIRDAPGFSTDRLDPESLKTLFLQLLKSEAKLHLQNELKQKDGTNGVKDGVAGGAGATASTQEMKSPQLSKIEDATEYAQLIPLMVDKLYFSYKDHALREIREEEERYKELLAKAGQTGPAVQDGGQRDDARQGVPATARQDGGMQTQQHGLPSQTLSHSPSITRRTSAGTPSRDGRPPSRPGTEIDSILNPEISDERPPHRPSVSAQTASPARPHPQGIAPTPPRTQANLSAATTPRLPPLASQNAPMQSPYEPVRPQIGGSPTFFNGQSPYHAPILPTVPGMAPAPLPPTTHWSPAGSPIMNRAPSSTMQSRQLPSPVVDQTRRTSLPPPIPSSPASQPTGPTNMYPSQPGLPYAGRQPGYQPNQYYQQPPPQRGGVMLPPFQVQPQAPITGTTHQAQRPVGTPQAVRPPVPPQQYAMSEPRGPPVRAVQDLRTSYQPTAQTPPARLASLKSTFFYSPGSRTGWKTALLRRPSQAPIRRPSLSPERDEVPISANGQQTPSMQDQKGVKSAKKSSTKKGDENVKSAKVPVAKKVKGGRASSALPPASLGNARTRSNSIASQRDGDSAIHEIKNEPPTPSVDMEDVSEVADTPTRPQGGRGRRGGINAASVAAAASRKRKREQESMVSDVDTPRAASGVTTAEESMVDASSGPPMILANRNFHKMTNPILHNITSHKHASLFANPVKERDAEGYSDIIKRPQDLKSIRTAIMAGSRAVAAATTSLTDSPAGAGPSTPSGGASAANTTPSGSNAAATSGVVQLPWSADIVPPRGIVNGAQLELELTRMFANAVMFNAGNEGVVEDTMEMFKETEVAVQAWRATEKEFNVAEIGRAKERERVELAENEDGEEFEEKDESVDELGDTDMAEVSSSNVVPSGRKRRGTLM